MEMFSRNIVFIRKLSGRTQPQFAELFDERVTLAMIKSYELERASPDFIFIERLAEIAGVEIPDLRKKQLKKEDIKLSVEKVVKGKKVKIESEMSSLEKNQIIKLFEENKRLLEEKVEKLEVEKKKLEQENRVLRANAPKRKMAMSGTNQNYKK